LCKKQACTALAQIGKTADMNINIAVKVTADEDNGIRRAAKFSGQRVADFVKSWVATGVQACEDDYIIVNSVLTRLN